MVNKAKLYVDMDGCLSDFEKQVKKLGPVPTQGLADDATEEQKQAMYDAIEAKGESFWADMDWAENGKKLWNAVKSYQPVLLSSPGKFMYAPAGKIKWVNRNLPGITLFLEEDKWLFVEPNAILIDDNENNVRDWDEAGGLGIFYENNPDEIKEKLKEILKEQVLHKQSKKLFEIDKDSIVKSGENGYLYCCTIPPHPAGMKLNDRNKRYVYLHRAVMELHLGRYLKDEEEVHHKNNDVTNNNLSNLKLTEFKKHQEDHSHKTKFWKKSPRNKPGRESCLKVCRNFIHKANYVSEVKIKPEWEKELREKGRSEDISPAMLKEKAESIGNKIQEREIKEPHLFIRALDKIIKYTTKIPDPSKHGFITNLTEYFNEVLPKIRKGEKFILKKEFQKKILNKAERLKDDGTLLKYIEELFIEKYKRSSLSCFLKRIARAIYRFSISSRQ